MTHRPLCGIFEDFERCIYLLPVEVKAGKTGTLRSLFQFLLEKKRRRAVRLHLGQPMREAIKLPGEERTTVQLLSLPLYMAGQMDRLLAEAFR